MERKQEEAINGRGNGRRQYEVIIIFLLSFRAQGKGGLAHLHFVPTGDRAHPPNEGVRVYSFGRRIELHVADPESFSIAHPLFGKYFCNRQELLANERVIESQAPAHRTDIIAL
jgi:hypothetical protein